MPKRSSDFEFRQQASLSQRVGYTIPSIQKLAGSDPEISDSIAVLNVLKKAKVIGDEIDFVLDILDALRLSHFATSDKTNEISKMGFMLPAKEARVTDE
jgi:hypothetical protein